MLILNLENTLLGSLGIETVSLEKDRVEMKMPADRRTHQPAGFLHGGASVALAETAASIGATSHVDSTEHDGFGIGASRTPATPKSRDVAPPAAPRSLQR